MLPFSWRCFVINLERSPERLKTISAQLAAAGIVFRRFAAVDGTTIDPNSFAPFDRGRYELRHGKLPARAEIGCFMSHIGVMRAFLESDAEHCLVLEDDAVIGARLGSALFELERAKQDWDVALLYGNHFGLPLTQRTLGPDHRLVGFFTRQTGAVAYALNRKAAQVYLMRLLPMSLPIDIDYDRAWDFGIKFRGVVPFPVTTGAYASDIGLTGRKFPWYRRLGTYACRTACEVRRVAHYAARDPIWLRAAKLQAAQFSATLTRAAEPLPGFLSPR